MSRKKHKRLKVLMVATEATPYAEVGGVSDVISYLSRTLNSLNHDVRIFMPKYGSIDFGKYKMRKVCEGLKVPTQDEANPYLMCNVKSCRSETGVLTYFLENKEYYEKRANIYGYSDDHTRWALLSRGVLEFIKTQKFVPDVIHCNDFHTGLVANYVKTVYKKDKLFDNIATVFTIHNLSYQGYMLNHMNPTELEFDDGKSAVASFFAARLNTQNLMKRGIMYSDAINTVSKTYAREILTPEFGEGLDKLLLELKGRLFGIINGIDYEENDPETDNLLVQNYNVNSLHLRWRNRRALQEEFNLPINKDALLLSYVGRLSYQKGVDLIVQALHHLLGDYNIQFAQVGGGDGDLSSMLRDLKSKFPDKVGIHPYPNFTLPKLLFAGSDCVLFPSRFEPCGIVQIEALRYGSVPIVRKVGGLADTVQNFDSTTSEGNGLVFTDFDIFSLFASIIRALELHQNKKLWSKLQRNAMMSDYSWEFSSTEYLKLYELALLFRIKKNVREKTIEDYLSS